MPAPPRHELTLALLCADAGALAGAFVDAGFLVPGPARALGIEHRPKSLEVHDLEPGWPRTAPFQVEGGGPGVFAGLSHSAGRNGAKRPPIRERGSPSARIGGPRGFSPGARVLVSGGFAFGRVLAFEREQFISSGQGGFRVFCPVHGTLVTAAFVPALTGWRAGGERIVACGCGASHDLAHLDFRPACGFSTEWLELLDAASDELDPAAAAVYQGQGPRGIVLRRG